jgi:argininosuccinate lyase
VLIGRLSGFLSVVKTPSARSDNLIFAYGEVPRSLEMARKVTRLMTGVVATLEVNAERMLESLLGGFSQATDLAEYVMQTCGVDYRTAYQVVGTAVRRAASEGLRGIDVSGEMLDAAASEMIGRDLGLSGRDLGEVLDPGSIVLTRTSPGGAAPEVVRGMTASVREGAEQARVGAELALEAIDEAERNLLRSAEARARA